MTAPRVRCAAAPIYRDKHMAVGRWYQVVDPEGRQFDLCSGACLVSYACYGALPADIGAAHTGTPAESEVAA